MQYDESYSDGGRITLSSILLLVIFISAAALIVAAIVWRPWFGESDSATNIQAPATEQQVDDNAEAALEGDAVANEDEVAAEPVAAQ